MSKSPRHWKTADVMDFEYLLAKEAGLSMEEKEARWRRDRQYYLEFADTLKARGLHERRVVFRCWLEKMRTRSGEFFPGASVVEAWKSLVTLLIVLMFAFGLSYAGALLLVFDRNEHVSVTKVFLATVGLQALVLVVAIAMASLRRSLMPRLGPFTSLRLAFITGVLNRFHVGKVRDSLKAALAMLVPTHRRYRKLLLANIVVATQASVIAMSLGLVTSLELYHFWVEDVRFGWSATRDLSDEQVFKIASFIAAPWSSIVPAAMPTPRQVMESRLSRDHPDRLVANDASQSWAAFLTFSILVYGVLLRGIAVLVLAVRRKGLTATLEFGHTEADSLWGRLTTDPPGFRPQQLPPQTQPKEAWWKKFLRFLRLMKPKSRST